MASYNGKVNRKEIRNTNSNYRSWDILGGLLVKIHLLIQGMRVKDLRSHMPHGQKPKT